MAIYVSYDLASEELAALHGVAKRAAEHGFGVYLPPRRWDPAAGLPEGLASRIREADSVLVLATARGPYLEHVQREIDAASEAGRPGLAIVEPFLTVLRPDGIPIVPLERQDVPRTLVEAMARIEKLPLEERQRRALGWFLAAGAIERTTSAERLDPEAATETQRVLATGVDLDYDARADAVMRLLDGWMADESGYDEETWPLLKKLLDEDRPSARKLFP